jgi:DNA modification methylase
MRRKAAKKHRNRMDEKSKSPRSKKPECDSSPARPVITPKAVTKRAANEKPEALVKRIKGSLVGLHEWRGHDSAGVPWEVYCGDSNAVLTNFVSNRFACVVTSPPYYWQRNYGVDGQIGLEPTIEQYVSSVADTMDQVRRVLRDDGCLFLNLGDTYYSGKGQPQGKDPKSKARRFGLRAVDASGLGVPRKTTIGIPWRVAIEMISRKWILRSPIIWAKEGAIPEPTAKDRPWRTYEHLFLFTKSPKYYFDRSALGKFEDIWMISDRPIANNGVHSAAFPDQLVEKCLAVGCPKAGEVLDPFAGTGTVLRVASRTGRRSTGVDLSRTFCEYIVKLLDSETNR